MIKIIHCADAHIDSPFVLNDPRNAEFRRMELRRSFTTLVMRAKNYGARLFLIAGDLFDEEYISKDTANFLIKEMASYPDCHFFIAPGETDPYNAKSPYKLMKWSDNVHIFKSPELAKIEIPELGVDVYGYAFTGEPIDTNPFVNKKPQNQSRINILVGHGELLSSQDAARNSNKIRVCPITLAQIERSGFDYIALGHLHIGTPGVQKTGNTFFSYPGCLTGRNFDEPGYKGAMYGEITKGKCELKGAKCSSIRFETLQVDISQFIMESQIYDAIRFVSDKYSDDTALRVELVGVQRQGFVFNPSEIEQRFTQFYFLQVTNKTVPQIDINHLKNDKTIRGIFYRQLEAKLNSRNEKERTEAHLALQYGLNAFAGLDIVDF